LSPPNALNGHSACLPQAGAKQAVYLPWRVEESPFAFFPPLVEGFFTCQERESWMLLMITPPIACGTHEGIVFEILIGVWLLVGSFLPKAKFYPGRLGTKQILPPIKPSWIPRLFIMAAGLAAILDGVWRIRHH
jgi:hypothetical protein